MARRNHKPKNRSLWEILQFSHEREIWCEKAIFFRQKIENMSKTVRYSAKLTTECGYKNL